MTTSPHAALVAAVQKLQRGIVLSKPSADNGNYAIPCSLTIDEAEATLAPLADAPVPSTTVGEMRFTLGGNDYEVTLPAGITISAPNLRPAPAPQGETAIRAIVRKAIAVHYEGINGTLEDVLVSALSASPPLLSEQALREQAEAWLYANLAATKLTGPAIVDNLVAFVHSLHRPPDAPG